MIKDWQQSKLWDKICNKESEGAEDVKILLNTKKVMPAIQSILQDGSGVTKDFTLHDASHSFRVAERMVEIIPAKVFDDLSVYELALLILSAYLHDIGMTPEHGKVKNHFEYLYYEKGSLSDKEKKDFRKWLLKEGSGIIPPLTPDTQEKRAKGEELLSYYCRAQHNDWSIEWIKSNLKEIDIDCYRTWIDDLIHLCNSHHYGFDYLNANHFSPKPVGKKSYMIHPRYLAMLLRVADILEFDPERTPAVLFRHRAVSDKSRIYWFKDHDVNLKIEKEYLHIYARPNSAVIHKAILDMVLDIERELQLCHDIAIKHGYDGSRTDSNFHRWKLKSLIYKDIKEREGCHVYIDGSFRPDAKRILELLGGTELYGNPLAAVRELLQNAFDAVKVKIATRRLKQPNPRDDEGMGLYIKESEIDLMFDDKNCMLICKDSGVGMTKEIIEKQFLAPGAPQRYDVIDLERRCTAAGFRLGRTGKFGIGGLSYFMIAEKIRITTTRCQEAGDSEGKEWVFEIDGMDDFGELKEHKAPQQNGTTVELYLKKELIQNPLQWFKDLKKYLEEILIKIPCNLKIRNLGDETENWEIKPGWVKDQESIKESIFFPYGCINICVKDRYETSSNKIELIHQVGELPQNMGNYRLTIPYFEIDGEKCLADIELKKENNDLLISTSPDTKESTIGYFPDKNHCIAWNGIDVDTESSLYSYLRFYPGILEINLENSEYANILVRRDRIRLKCDKKILSSLINQVIEEELKNIYQSLFDNGLFKLINSRILNMPPAQIESDMLWFKREEKNLFKFQNLSFPIGIFPEEYDYSQSDNDNYTWKKKPVIFFPKVSFAQPGGAGGEYLNWCAYGQSPDWIVIKSLDNGDYCYIWEKYRRQITITASNIWPHSKQLLGVFSYSPFSRGNDRILNKRHPIYPQITQESWDWISSEINRLIDRTPKFEEIIKNPLILKKKEYAAAWMLYFFEYWNFRVWEDIVNKNPSFLEGIFNKLYPGVDATEKSFYILKLTHRDTRLFQFSPGGCVKIEDKVEIARHLNWTDFSNCPLEVVK